MQLRHTQKNPCSGPGSVERAPVRRLRKPFVVSMRLMVSGIGHCVSRRELRVDDNASIRAQKDVQELLTCKPYLAKRSLFLSKFCDRLFSFHRLLLKNRVFRSLLLLRITNLAKT